MAQKAPGVLKLNRIHTTKDKKGSHILLPANRSRSARCHQLSHFDPQALTSWQFSSFYKDLLVFELYFTFRLDILHFPFFQLAYLTRFGEIAPISSFLILCQAYIYSSRIAG